MINNDNLSFATRFVITMCVFLVGIILYKNYTREPSMYVIEKDRKVYTAKVIRWTNENCVKMFGEVNGNNHTICNVDYIRKEVK
jgi:hypothetical protein